MMQMQSARRDLARELERYSNFECGRVSLETVAGFMRKALLHVAQDNKIRDDVVSRLRIVGCTLIKQKLLHLRSRGLSVGGTTYGDTWTFNVNDDGDDDDKDDG